MIDWVALTQVLASGECYGPDEPVPGHVLPRSAPELIVPFPAEEFSGTWQEALETVDALVRQVLEETPADVGFSLGLSGGRDSRHLLMAARAVDRPVVECVTAQHWKPGASSADVQGAQALASALGLSLEVLPLARDRWAAEWEKNRLLGLRTVNHSWLLPMVQRLGSERPLLDGLNGGNLLGRDALTRTWVERHGAQRPLPGEALDHAMRHLLRAPRKRLASWLKSPRIERAVWKEAEERLESRFRSYLDYPNPFQAWSYLEHTRKGIALAPYVLMGNDDVVCPYYDARVASFGLSLPWSISSRPDFQVDMLARAYPEVASIPYAHDFPREATSLDVDVAAEAESWQRVAPWLRGHVDEDFIGRQPGTPGNRRMVLLAQALAWEQQGQGSTLTSV